MTNSTRICSFDGCGRTAHCRDLCSGHYMQRHRRGQELRPLGRKAYVSGMTPAERFEHYTDRTGICHTWIGPLNEKGYGKFSVNAVYKKAHRVAYERAYGEIPEGAQVDHTCHNRACVNPEHLRAVTGKQNSENRAGANRGNESGYRNVYFNPRYNKWHAQVTHKLKKYHLGYFEDVHTAGAAAKAKRLELFTHSDGR